MRMCKRITQQKLMSNQKIRREVLIKIMLFKLRSAFFLWEEKTKLIVVSNITT